MHAARRRAAGSIATAIVLSLGLGACFAPTTQPPQPQPTVATPSAQAVDLDNEAAALQDLRGCLAITSSNDQSVLNVFYLIDNSGSLDEDKNPSDPDGERVEILKRSLDALAKLGDDVQLNWSAATFSDSFDQPRSWATYGVGADGQSLASVVPDDAAGGTNWERAVRGAQDSLAKQQRAVPGCALLIWFTDGLISVRGGTAATAAAIDALCGVGNQTPGLVQELRRDQVVVFGVLLNKSDGAEASQLLTRLVEGQADPDDGVVGSCGNQSSTDVHGTVAVVDDVGDLAEIFDELPLTLDGARRGDDVDPASGEFLVPLGVSRFVVQLGERADGWSLFAPNGETLTEGDLDWPHGLSVRTSTSGSKDSVEVEIESTEHNGTWTIVDYSYAQDALYRYSDLSLALDDIEGANLGIVSGEGSTLTGVVLDRGGAPAALERYLFDWIIQERLPGEPAPRDLPTETPTADDARFTIDIGATNAEPGDRMRVVMTLADLRTVDGNVALEGPSVSLLLTVLSPDQVPQDLQIMFSEPAGSSSSPARGTIGAATVPAEVAVAVLVRDDGVLTTSDRFDREFVLVQDGEACEGQVAVCGEFTSVQRSVPISIGIASGEKPQYSSVSGEVLVELVVPPEPGSDSAPPVRVLNTIPFELETERPINLGLLIALLILLLLIGLAIPVALAWVLKRALVRIQHGRLLQRAEFPIEITDGIPRLTTTDLADESAISSVFRNLSPQGQVTSHTDARLGFFKVHVPAHPLSAAWFGVRPPNGTRLITANSGNAPRRHSSAIRTGKLATTNGSLAGMWAVAATDSDLAESVTTGTLKGTLVVYLRPVLGEQGQYGKRLREILTQTDWRARVKDVVREVVSQSVENSGRGDPSGKDVKSPARPDDGSKALRRDSDGPPSPPGRSKPQQSSTPESSRPNRRPSQPNTTGDRHPRPPGR